MPTEQQIQFDHIGLGTALARNRLRVPPNQREYAWEDSHVLDLFEDVGNAIREGKESYFLGTIVLTAGRNGTLEVADGQQRLATTTILLSAIRDHHQEHGAEILVRAIEDKFLFEIDRKARTEIPHLSLNVDDNEYFRSHILCRPGSPERAREATKISHRRIERAAKLAKQHIATILKPYNEKQHIDVLEDWTSFLESKARVILLSVLDGLNAFVMFETLNDRGLKTSQSDLVKNYLFGEADDRGHEAQQKWAAMSGTLETLGEDDITITYLRHLLISQGGHLRERDVFERVRKVASGPAGAIQFLEDLAQASVDYVATFMPDHPKWNAYHGSVRRSLQTIQQIRVKVIRPLLLAVARKFDHKEAATTFEMLVSWAVRFLIVGGGRSGTVEEKFADLALSVNGGSIVTSEDLSRSADFVPTDAQFKAGFESATVSLAYLARYYLRALELTKKEQPEPELIPNDDTRLTLEHVLPREPEQNWPDIDPERASAMYRRIGNMCLLPATVNSDLGSGAFDEKKAAYKKSGLILTNQIAQNEKWGPDQIVSRQTALADLAVKTWPRQLTGRRATLRTRSDR